MTSNGDLDLLKWKLAHMLLLPQGRSHWLILVVLRLCVLSSVRDRRT